MSNLALITYIFAGLLVVRGLLSLMAPARLCAMMREFPRSRLSAGLLTAVDLIWVGWIIFHAHLGRFEHLKPLVWIATPIAFVLLFVFMDDLLAPRAAGGFLLLLANPILAMTRQHPSSWRLVMVTVAYVGIVLGMVLVLAPWHIHRLIGGVAGTERRARLVGAAGLVLAVFLGVLAATVY